MMTEPTQLEYFRRDQARGVTAPDLSKRCTFAEHVVRARGKRTAFTSVSLDPDRIDDFGPILYPLLRDDAECKGHRLIEHAALIQALRDAARTSTKADKVRAIQAQRYAVRRREGIVVWAFVITSVPTKNLVTWAYTQIAPFFARTT